jgi:hypothetical protein
MRNGYDGFNQSGLVIGENPQQELQGKLAFSLDSRPANGCPLFALCPSIRQHRAGKDKRPDSLKDDLPIPPDLRRDS